MQFGEAWRLSSLPRLSSFGLVLALAPDEQKPLEKPYNELYGLVDLGKDPVCDGPVLGMVRSSFDHIEPELKHHSMAVLLAEAIFSLKLARPTSSLEWEEVGISAASLFTFIQELVRARAKV